MERNCCTVYLWINDGKARRIKIPSNLICVHAYTFSIGSLKVGSGPGSVTLPLGQMALGKLSFFT